MTLQTKQQLVSAIRKEWMRHSRKFAAIQKAAERVQLEDGRYKTFIRCARCSELFDRADIQCNHLVPVGPLASTSAEDVADYRSRMFCPVHLLEPQCTECHRKTTKEQRNSNEQTHH